MRVKVKLLQILSIILSILFSTTTIANTYEYQYNFAVFNKSFSEDLERSLNLYQSFEQYFVDAENIPFYVVIREEELELFKKKFEEHKKAKKILRIPRFITDQWVLKKCGEPNISKHGYWTQLVSKLCFGTLGITKYYITLDSDSYFTRPFDKKILFSGDIIKTYGYKLNKDEVEWSKNQKTVFYRFNCSENERYNQSTVDNLSVYDKRMLVKKFFGNKNPDIYNFVITHNFFSSDAIHRMKKFIKEKEFNFSLLQFLYPWEFQWYGEYILQHETFIPAPSLFSIVNRDTDCVSEKGYDSDYGITYQSVSYQGWDKNRPEIHRRDKIIYKKPSTCK